MRIRHLTEFWQKLYSYNEKGKCLFENDDYKTPLVKIKKFVKQRVSNDNQNVKSLLDSVLTVVEDTSDTEQPGQIRGIETKVLVEGTGLDTLDE